MSVESRTPIPVRWDQLPFGDFPKKWLFQICGVISQSRGQVESVTPYEIRDSGNNLCNSAVEFNERLGIRIESPGEEAVRFGFGQPTAAWALRFTDSARPGTSYTIKFRVRYHYDAYNQDVSDTTEYRVTCREARSTDDPSRNWAGSFYRV